MTPATLVRRCTDAELAETAERATTAASFWRVAAVVTVLVGVLAAWWAPITAVLSIGAVLWCIGMHRSEVALLVACAEEASRRRHSTWRGT